MTPMFTYHVGWYCCVIIGLLSLQHLVYASGLTCGVPSANTLLVKSLCYDAGVFVRFGVCLRTVYAYSSTRPVSTAFVFVMYMLRAQ